MNIEINLHRYTASQGQRWQYIFYVDYQISAPALADAAMERLGAHCSMVRELGRYRTAELPT